MVADEMSFEVQLSGNLESNFVFSYSFIRGRIEAAAFLSKMFAFLFPVLSIFLSQSNFFLFFFFFPC